MSKTLEIDRDPRTNGHDFTESATCRRCGITRARWGQSWHGCFPPERLTGPTMKTGYDPALAEWEAAALHHRFVTERRAPPMSDHDALLAAVLAAPADDLPRLVYADHLDESAVTAVWAQPGPEKEAVSEDERRLSLLYRRAAVIVHAHYREWTDNGERPPLHYEFHRGFVRDVSGTFGRLRRYLPAVVARHPVERVEVTDCDPVETRAGWECPVSGRSDHRTYIPWDVFDLFPTAWFATADAARKALSDALLIGAHKRYARLLAPPRVPA